MDSNKVVFIASFPDSLLNFRLQLMQACQDKGFEVVAIAPENASVQKKLESYQIRFIAIPLARNGLNPIQDFKLMRVLRQILRKERPQIVFSYTIKPVIYGSLVARLVKIPKIYALITGTGYVFLDHSIKTRLIGVVARGLFRIALRCAHKVFFQNQDNQALFLQKNLVNKNAKTCVVNGSGVDCDVFLPAPYPVDLSFLMIARLLYDKGVREYVAAAKILRRRYPHLKFKLVGWIDSNPNAVSKTELGNWVESGDIEYLGKLEDVRPAIADSSVYVLPSYHEGTPRTVLEAMAMGRPIVTTDAPGCRETVIPGQNGFLVPPKAVEPLCEMMEQFIKAPQLIPEMGIASRKIALGKYDVNKVNASILKEMGLE